MEIIEILLVSLLSARFDAKHATSACSKGADHSLGASDISSVTCKDIWQQKSFSLGPRSVSLNRVKMAIPYQILSFGEVVRF